jgi:D-sedoheptulose 7-phosphate isomerase
VSNTASIVNELRQAASVLDGVLANPGLIRNIGQASSALIESLKGGGKVITCGNGGSHCDAMHFAEEMTGRFRENRKPLAALCISDPSHLTCVANDFGFEQVFARSVEALGRPGDVLLAISTSGNSMNVVRAAEKARDMGIRVLSLTGNDGGKLARLSDVEVRVPFTGYSDRIQEVHIKIIHILIHLTEKQV